MLPIVVRVRWPPRRRPTRDGSYGVSGRTSFLTIKLQKRGGTTIWFYVKEKSCPSAVGGGVVD
ncbi:MAG TPA: hypothetical protein VJI15_03360 [Candidatus Nanoarchaeia archaeon]|nr:hypothetical protein [Candidatus Nanoarchaeia archaeon]